MASREALHSPFRATEQLCSSKTNAQAQESVGFPTCAGITESLAAPVSYAESKCQAALKLIQLFF
jgi:hypothetical protein